MSGVSFLLRIVIGIIAVGIVAGAITAGIIYYMNNSAPPTPVGPTGPAPPPGKELDMVFVNTYTDHSVWIVPTFGTTTDNSPRWTDWDLVNPGTSSLDVYIPHSAELEAKEIKPGETVMIPVLTGGMASVNFIFRYDCDPATMICKYGDSSYVPQLDYNPDGSFKRGSVPLKPAIDTRVEISWACAYSSNQYCTINPTCILPTSGCYPDLASQFADDSTLKIEKDGLMYSTKTGVKTQVPFTTGQYLTGNTFFDITCVDGYTIPIILQVKRPLGAVNSTASTCYTSGSQIDSTGDEKWKTLANTRLFSLADCPTNEVLWTPPLSVGVLTGATGDGWNSHSGSAQQPLPYQTGAGTKLTAAFVPGVAFDLKTYRNPQELDAVPPSMGFSATDVIGCSAPCSFLTKNQSVTQFYPKPGGKYSTAVYTQGVDPLVPSELGVTDVCCDAQTGTTPLFDSNLQCNTSKAWTKPPATGNVPVQPGDLIAQYNFGFYVADFAPSPGSTEDQPWWDPITETSKNPYRNVTSRQSKYIATVRNHLSGQLQETRAYSYQHDDAWSTIQCTTSDPAAIHVADDYRGTYYNRYRIRVVIGDGPMPPD